MYLPMSLYSLPLIVRFLPMEAYMDVENMELHCEWPQGDWKRNFQRYSQVCHYIIWVITNGGKICSELSVARCILEGEKNVLPRGTVQTSHPPPQIRVAWSWWVTHRVPSRLVVSALGDVAFCDQCWGLLVTYKELGLSTWQGLLVSSIMAKTIVPS